MFIKAFKVKNNVQLKGSDVKKLRTKLQASYRSVSEESLNILLPNKCNLGMVKIETYGGDVVTVYTVAKRPLFFELNKNVLVPTVYSLWMTPDLIPTFTTHPAVLPRLGNGADLMLPGIIKIGHGLHTYGNYKKDQLVSINLTNNMSSIAIGQMARSSEDLYMAGSVGIGVKILHVFGDKLWGLDPSVTMQIPVKEPVFSIPKDEDFPALGSEKKTSSQKVEQTLEEQVIVDNIEERKELDNDNDNDNNDDNSVVVGNTEPEEESMDDILKKAFMIVLKREGKKLHLPILTSTFYKCHILPTATKPIDLKQTSYKKFSKFLHQMDQERFITVKEEQKGVEKIFSVNLTHPQLDDFLLPAVGSQLDKEGATDEGQLFVTEMVELYLVTAETAKFFNQINLAEGEGIDGSQVKKTLKDYVCNKKLQDPVNVKIIKIDELLAITTDKQVNETIQFDLLLKIILERMTHTYEMRSKSEIKSGIQTHITMKLAKRSGNKTVTLVDSLETYGIRLDEFAKACKIGVAASTSIVKLPHSKSDQFLVQGNQIKFVYNLLTETYKIPPKNILGKELAGKEKKKKK